MAQIKELVLTGGPASGKSTALPVLSDHFRQHGWNVYAVPEVATILMESGVVIAGLPTEDLVNVERQILILQHSLRMRYQALAEASGVDTVIIYDRAECDIAAYIPDHAAALLAESNRTLAGVAESYDGVLFLRSTAVDLPELYSSATNEHRYESVTDAAALDGALLDAWLDAHMGVIDNSTDWEGKLERVIAHADRLLGIPQSLEIERRFLVRRPDLGSLPQRATDIEQRYSVVEENREIRVRRRRRATDESYQQTEKKTIRPGVREEKEHHIDQSDFDAAPILDGTRPVVKTRSVVVDGELWEVDQFHTVPGLYIVEVELPSLDTPLTLPTWMDGALEITEDKHYSNRSISNNEWQPRPEHLHFIG